MQYKSSINVCIYTECAYSIEQTFVTQKNTFTDVKVLFIFIFKCCEQLAGHEHIST